MRSFQHPSQRLIQPKLALGPVNDPFEREADEIAEQITRGNGRAGSPPTPSVQPTLQRQSSPTIANSTTAVTPQVETAIQQSSGGQTLPSATRAPMEQAMGFDFSKVRIHTDRRADQLNRSLTARAFTTGQDIFFREGEYQPGSSEGQKLLAHELTHVAQQQGQEPTVIQRWPEEVEDELDPEAISNYKCHDAVVYWVLRSLDYNKVDALAMLRLFRQKSGPSADWIAKALNYTDEQPISGAEETQVGDILFTGHPKHVTHTMIVINHEQIKGFNNSGTFRTVEGDQYSKENFADPKFWHGGQMGASPSASYPVYKVSIEDAKAALRKFIESVETQVEDYQIKSVYMGDDLDYIDDAPASKKKRRCFITTAVTAAKGLPDDCEELTVLRRFRDGYLLQKPNGAELIEIYYQYSPLIVEALARQINAASLYEQLYRVIRQCVDAIQCGDNEFAYKTYCEMVLRLKEQFLSDIPFRMLGNE